MSSSESKQPKIAFVHEWLITHGGSELVLQDMLAVWPKADIFTLVYNPDGPCKHIVGDHRVTTSFIQKLPKAMGKHRAYLPLMPIAIEQFDLRRYDIVISCSHAVAHGIIPQANQLHINYICIPVRYAWHLYHQYLEESNLTKGIKGVLAKIILHYLRLWDFSASQRVDSFVAISNWVAKNVWRAYRRPADVIYPPVNIDDFLLSKKVKEDFFITSSRIVPYKKIDLIVDTFTQLGEKKLIVVGDGPDLEKIKAAAGSNISFLGFLPKDSLIDYLQRAKAFIFAAEEDFGIVPVEAQACGTPVIAYGKGGALETVIDGETGIFFNEQTSDSLIQAIKRFEEISPTFDPETLRKNAERFSKVRFQKEIKEFVEKKWQEFSMS